MTMTQMEACEFAKCGSYPQCDPSCVSNHCLDTCSGACAIQAAKRDIACTPSGTHNCGQ